MSVLGAIRSRCIRLLTNPQRRRGLCEYGWESLRRRRCFPREKVSAMAAVMQEPEITLAQRLASNDKPIRTKALKTLRKYINLRSQKVEGGFQSEDLLKIWKGLFYCLWMQDKPLLQEELSHRISGLIHSFHTTDNQLLYFATFLQTVKREWNGIDRLRMDKYFQLVRFMFRQAFEVLKRREWESSAVNHLLKVFTEQLLQNTDSVPKGLMLHILDLYMTELALVGSAELTAEQNLIFLDPFCKTVAKTKDRLLLAFISKNVFMRIVDHAPFAIEDLMRELKQAGGDDSDSGQASGEEEEEREEEKLKSKASEKKVKKINGIPADVENYKGNEHDLDLESISSEDKDGVGPVLQFDYGAIADHLFELGSHLNTRNINRTKMYSLVKIFRDLSEGVFSHNGDNNGDVSDMPDNEAFIKEKSKKKKKKKNKRPVTREVSGDVSKNIKGCQDKQKSSETVQDDILNDITENLKIAKKDEADIADPDIGKAHEGESDSQSHLETGIIVKKKKKCKKLKTNLHDVEEVAHEFQLDLGESHGDHQTDSCKAVLKQNCFEATSGVGSTQTNTEVKALVQTSADQMSDMASLPVEAGQAECVILPIKKKNKKMNVKKEKTVEEQIVEKLPVDFSVHDQLETTKPESDKAKSQTCDPVQLEASTVVRKKKKSRNQSTGLQDIREEVAVSSLIAEVNAGDENRKLSTSQTMDGDDNATQRQLGTSTTQKKAVKKKKQKPCLQEVEIAVTSPETCENSEQNDEINRHACSVSVEEDILQSRQAASITKKKKKSKTLASSSKVIDSISQDGYNESTDVAPAVAVTSTEAEPSEALVVRTKSSKKKVKAITGSKTESGLGVKDPELISDSTNITVTEKQSDAKCSQAKSMKKAKKKTLLFANEDEPMLEDEKQSLLEPESITHTNTPWKMKKGQKRKSPAAELKEEPFLKKNTDKDIPDTMPSDNVCTPKISSLTPMKKGKKKRRLQTDEAETSLCNGHADEELNRKKVKSSVTEDSTSVTPKKLKMEKASPKPDFVSFHMLTKAPTPLFCKTKPKDCTPLCSKKLQTPKSETKKVTFGLKNNKTTEFRKTDRSLLVSPVGSSRVAFDPKKKPVSGVLKSPSLQSPVLNIKKMAKKRATAADFF